ncbi:MAG: tetratricopeptide repeat protein [Gemmatimonadaceae bacterium]
MTSRLEAFRGMVAKNPTNALAHFGLANEAMKEGQWEEARQHYETYLGMHDDEGNAYGRLAEAYERVGRNDDARAALERGIAAANRFGHPGMAQELELRLDELA